MKRYIRTKEGIYDLKHPHKSFFVIKNRSVDDKNCYVSWRWDDWKDYFLIDSFNCILFPYHSAKDFIRKLKQEKLDYEDLVIELSPYYSKCRQADTVEELCDVFICESNEEENDFYAIYPNICSMMKSDFFIKHYEHYNFYAGIQVKGKGIIYVARVTNKGGLISYEPR